MTPHSSIASMPDFRLRPLGYDDITRARIAWGVTSSWQRNRHCS